MTKIREYKVIALSIGGHNNKIYNHGDTVKEDNFPPGNAEAMVAKGFLERAGESDEKPTKVGLLADFTTKELKDLLNEKEIPFGNKDSKADLFDKLKTYMSQLGIEYNEETLTKDELIALLSE